jgi:3-deoxy-D-manno-octulosonic acid (KDO) 8-phosphate synthase
MNIYHAIQELLDESTFLYQEMLNAFSSVQINLLKAIAKEKMVEKIHAGDFVSKYNLKNVSSVNRALNSLINMETIYKSENGYMVYDRFLGMWLHRFK